MCADRSRSTGESPRTEIAGAKDSHILNVDGTYQIVPQKGSVEERLPGCEQRQTRQLDPGQYRDGSP